MVVLPESLTRTLNYEEVEDAGNADDEFNKEVAEAVPGVDSNQEMQQSAVVQTVAGGKSFCDVDNCLEFNFLPGWPVVSVKQIYILNVSSGLFEGCTSTHKDVIVKSFAPMFVAGGMGMAKKILPLSGKSARTYRI
jgi:hypothetical protein